MAVRLVNLYRQPLRVELRGGAVVILAPGQRSVALREELLYDNTHLAEWERAGWMRRLPARMSDVQADEAANAQPQPALPPAKQASVAEPLVAGPRRSATTRAARSPAGKARR